MLGGGPNGPAAKIGLTDAIERAMDTTFVVERDGEIVHVNPVVTPILPAS
jgi:hypothetical protein